MRNAPAGRETAIVTSGGSGLGRGLLPLEGANVLVADFSKPCKPDH